MDREAGRRFTMRLPPLSHFSVWSERCQRTKPNRDDGSRAGHHRVALVGAGPLLSDRTVSARLGSPDRIAGPLASRRAEYSSESQRYQRRLRGRLALDDRRRSHVPADLLRRLLHHFADDRVDIVVPVVLMKVPGLLTSIAT